MFPFQKGEFYMTTTLALGTACKHKGKHYTTEDFTVLYLHQGQRMVRNHQFTASLLHHFLAFRHLKLVRPTF